MTNTYFLHIYDAAVRLWINLILDKQNQAW